VKTSKIAIFPTSNQSVTLWKRPKKRVFTQNLKPGEAAAVLRRLLEAHPDLANEAEEIGRSLLHQVEYQEVAAEIEDEMRALDYEVLNARAGSHE